MIFNFYFCVIYVFNDVLLEGFVGLSKRDSWIEDWPCACQRFLIFYMLKKKIKKSPIRFVVSVYIMVLFVWPVFCTVHIHYISVSFLCFWFIWVSLYRYISTVLHNSGTFYQSLFYKSLLCHLTLIMCI